MKKVKQLRWLFRGLAALAGLNWALFAIPREIPWGITFGVCFVIGLVLASVQAYLEIREEQNK